MKKEYSVYDIVYKLVGKIDPVGESHIDEERYDNLEKMIELVDKLIYDIDSVGYRNYARQEFSMNKAGKRALQFLEDLGIEE